jgi:hypothetical protein
MKRFSPLLCDQRGEAHKSVQKPYFMTDHKPQIEAIKLLGYAEAEAQFLHLVATHSGYFLPRQFVGSAGSHSGSRTTQFCKKLKDNQHARQRRVSAAGNVFSLCSRTIYKQANVERVRTYRDHETEHIHTRLGILDFVLQNPGYRYLETESEKVAYFSAVHEVPAHDLPSKKFGGRHLTKGTERYFTDKTIIFFAPDSSRERINFSFFQGAELSLDGFAPHLKSYLPLFHRLSKFDFWFLARHGCHFVSASELFRDLVVLPLQSNPSSDLLRYFRIRKVWDLGDLGSLTESDLSFRHQVKERFDGHRFENMYRSWRANQIPESEIRFIIGGTDEPHTVRIHTQVVNPIGTKSETPGVGR